MSSWCFCKDCQPFVNSERFRFLVHPFWNHRLSLKSDWLSSAEWFIHKSHLTVYFLLNSVNCIFFLANENGILKQNNQISRLFQNNQSHCSKMKGKKPLFGKFWYWPKSCSSCISAIKFCNFKTDVIKWQLNWVACNFGLKSLLWFEIEPAVAHCLAMA